LLVPPALFKAISDRISERNKRTGDARSFLGNVEALLLSLTDAMKHAVQAQYLKRQHPYSKGLNKSVDDTSITSQLLSSFDDKWSNLESRLDMVSGKEVLSRLNSHLQQTCGVTVTPTLIIEAMSESDIPDEMKAIISSLHDFATAAHRQRP
jgi:hypothetical protein